MNLPEGITLNQDPSIAPIGAIITETNVARTCVRCGHQECPCCNDFCDHCINEDVGPGDRLDGEFVVHVYSNGETRHHIECAREMSCKFDRESHPLIGELFRVNGEVFGNDGGSFGVTVDGRVWFRGTTHEERTRRERAKVRLERIVTSTRRMKMSKLEELFAKMSNDQRAAYLEGMKHAEMIAEWSADDFRKAGKQISEQAASKAKQDISTEIERFENLNA